jgi:hypothetical protein
MIRRGQVMNAGKGTGHIKSLGDLTWPEADRLAADGALLAVPVGPVARPGPHLLLVPIPTSRWLWPTGWPQPGWT